MSIRLFGFFALIGLILFIAACQPTSAPAPEVSVDSEPEQAVAAPTTPAKQVAEDDSPAEPEEVSGADPTDTPTPPPTAVPTAVAEDGPEQAAILKILQAVARTNRAEERAPTFRGTAVPQPTPNVEEVQALADYLPVLGEAPEVLNETWINTDGPLRLEDLEGQVVLIEFWTFG